MGLPGGPGGHGPVALMCPSGRKARFNCKVFLSTRLQRVSIPLHEYLGPVIYKFKSNDVYYQDPNDRHRIAICDVNYNLCDAFPT